LPKSNADRIAKLEHEQIKQGRVVSGLLLRLAKLETAVAIMRPGQQAQDEEICAIARQSEESSR
jgi:hypothetical protein